MDGAAWGGARGLAKVRGGTHTQPDLSLGVVRTLKAELDHAAGGCTRCGRPCHFTATCNARTRRSGTFLPPKGKGKMTSGGGGGGGGGGAGGGFGGGDSRGGGGGGDGGSDGGIWIPPKITVESRPAASATLTDPTGPAAASSSSASSSSSSSSSSSCCGWCGHAGHASSACHARVDYRGVDLRNEHCGRCSLL